MHPPDDLENQNFEIMKNPGDIIILHMFTVNDDHMMFDVYWDMECDRQNLFVF